MSHPFKNRLLGRGLALAAALALSLPVAALAQDNPGDPSPYDPGAEGSGLEGFSEAWIAETHTEDGEPGALIAFLYFWGWDWTIFDDPHPGGDGPGGEGGDDEPPGDDDPEPTDDDPEPTDDDPEPTDDDDEPQEDSAGSTGYQPGLSSMTAMLDLRQVLAEAPPHIRPALAAQLDAAVSEAIQDAIANLSGPQ